MSNNIEDDSWCIGVIVFLLLWVVFWRILEDVSDSLLCSLFVSLCGFGVYKIIKYVWKG